MCGGCIFAVVCFFIRYHESIMDVFVIYVFHGVLGCGLLSVSFKNFPSIPVRKENDRAVSTSVGHCRSFFLLEKTGKRGLKIQLCIINFYRIVCVWVPDLFSIKEN